MLHIFTDLLVAIASTVWDVIPIVIVIFGFQRLVLRKPVPNRKKLIIGFVRVLLGLGFFLEGLQAALFPLGRLMAQQLTDPAFIAAPFCFGVWPESRSRVSISGPCSRISTFVAS